MNASIESYIRELVRETVKGMYPHFANPLTGRTTRVQLVAANWKMNHTLEDAIRFLYEIKVDRGISTVVCPPNHLLYPMSTYLKETAGAFKLGGQNVHWEDQGAFTGEVSADMLREAGCDYVIIGHSERRQYAGETNEQISWKLHKATEKDLIPILCIGENLEQKDLGQTDSVLRAQLEGALAARPKGPIVVAYEPVWAIGTGKSATPDYAQATHAFIRRVLRDQIGEEAEWTPIIYGGSVKKENASGFAEQPDVDGALVGGASLESDSFEAIILAFTKGD